MEAAEDDNKNQNNINNDKKPNNNIYNDGDSISHIVDRIWACHIYNNIANFLILRVLRSDLERKMCNLQLKGLTINGVMECAVHIGNT